MNSLPPLHAGTYLAPAGLTTSIAATTGQSATAPTSNPAPTPSFVVSLSPAATKQDELSHALAGLAAASARLASDNGQPVTGNVLSMSIKTQSGVVVALHLTMQDNKPAVELDSDGDLNDAEQHALTSLVESAQSALVGAGSPSPLLNVDGLVHFDSTALASVGVHMTAGVQVFIGGKPSIDTRSLDVHADAKQRSVSFGSMAGTVKLDVDLSNPQLRGSAKQQAKAIGLYLLQIDQATSRGHGDAMLSGLFKQAFSQLNGDAPAAATTALNSFANPPLSDLDRSMLTGLADFSGEIVQTATHPNPAHQDEVDGFSYRVAQSTSSTGRAGWDLSLKQQQESSLKGSYHQSLDPRSPLQLDYDRKTQNYTYHEIEDTASSTAELGYRDGKLVRATLSLTAHQLTRVQKYVLGDLVDEQTLPVNLQTAKDLLPTLTAIQKAPHETPKELEQRRQALDAVNDGVFLQAYPSAQ
jgi:hypothetical protein